MFSAKTLGQVGATAGLAGLVANAHAAWDLNLPRGVTPISQQAYDLHMLILWVCVAIGVVVFGAMFYSMAVHRRSVGAEAAHFHHSTFAEIVWTFIPFVILIAMAIPATKALVMMEDTSEADMTLKITGYQWKWKYDYVEDEITIHSALNAKSRTLTHGDPTGHKNYLLDVDNEVVLPIKKKVRLLLTADDVIHAWWVPELGQKKDAIPGYVNQMWTYIKEPGVYRGQCAELCGRDHGFMPIVVRAVTPDEYQAWVAKHHGAAEAATASAAAEAMKDWTKDDLVARGKEVYAASCQACHQANGQGVPGTFPAIAGSKVATGPLDGHLQLVLNGKPNTAMAAFGAQLSDTDIAAVITYQRNSFGNSTGDMVQPKGVQAAR
jgi:cytochrome c oxidase subunit II